MKVVLRFSVQPSTFRVHNLYLGLHIQGYSIQFKRYVFTLLHLDVLVIKQIFLGEYFAMSICKSKLYTYDMLN